MVVCEVAKRVDRYGMLMVKHLHRGGLERKVRWSDRYQVLERLRDDRYERLYRAVDHVQQRKVMLNVRVQTWVKNVQLCKRMKHPHLMNIYEVDQKGDHVLVVMEDAKMWSLQELLRQEAPFPVEKAVAITIQMCQALEYIHGYGRQHQQICPQHIFATSQGVFRLLYLECMSLGENEQERAYFPYLSPEHLQGVYLDDSSDLYSLTVVLYQMLTGRLPWQHGQPPRADLFDPKVIGVNIPEKLCQLIRKGMSSRRYNRFRTAVEMKQALVAIYRQMPQYHPLPTFPKQELAEKRRRFRWFILLAAVSVFLSIVGHSDGLLWANQSTKQAEETMMKKDFCPANLIHKDIYFGDLKKGAFLKEGRR